MPSRAIIDARFSPDGKWLGVLAVDLPRQAVRPANRSSARLDRHSSRSGTWPRGERLRSTELGRGYDGKLAFRPDGRQVAVRVDEYEGQKSSSRVLIVDAEDGRVIRTLIEGKPINDALAYSPDGSLLVGPGPEAKLNVWDAETGQGGADDRHEGSIRSRRSFPPRRDTTGRGWRQRKSDDLVGPRLGAPAVVAGERAASNALSIQPRRQIPGDAGFELDQDLGRGYRRVPIPDPRCRLRPGLHSGWSEDRGGGRRGHGAILGCQAGARRSRS